MPRTRQKSVIQLMTHKGIGVTHFPQTSKHIVIAGKEVAGFKAKHPFIQSSVGGTHGTMEMTVERNGRSKKGVIYFEVPSVHQGKGLGTSLIKSAEQIAREKELDSIEAVTDNPNAAKIFKKLGWVFVEKNKSGEVFRKELR